jgi:hypothetical protein
MNVHCSIAFLNFVEGDPSAAHAMAWPKPLDDDLGAYACSVLARTTILDSKKIKVDRPTRFFGSIVEQAKTVAHEVR